MQFFDDVHTIATQLVEINKSLVSINTALQSISQQLIILVQGAEGDKIVGIGIQPGVPTVHSQKGNPSMKMVLLKKTMKGTPHKIGAAPITQFGLMDNGDCTFTVFGLDAAGNQIDISTVATMSCSSDNTAVVTVDTPTGMGSAMHTPTNPAPQIGQTANISVVVTWSDPTTAPPGSPFNFTLPVTIQPGAVSGITIVPGTPTTH